MVRDVGASLGEAEQFPLFALLGTRGLQGTKNNIDGLRAAGIHHERRRRRAWSSTIAGRNGVLLNSDQVPDVIWACELLARIPDGHWQAAFRAGHYSA